MPDGLNAPALFFAPFVSSRMQVEPGWIDYNGHLNMAYYNVLFDRGVDELFSLVGLGPDYVRARNASFFAAETHVRYLRELALSDRVRVTIQLIDFDDKRMHFFMELRHADEGWVSATSECLSLHVDMAQRKVSPFPSDILTNLALLKAAHARLARPTDAGRAITMRRSAPVAEPQLAAAPTCH
jgi:acyl-CoA thioester hydrolase